MRIAAVSIDLRYKECLNFEFVKQKLNYIDFNPWAGKWNLAHIPEKYSHSSTAFYGTREQGIPVNNIMDILDVDLSKRI